MNANTMTMRTNAVTPIMMAGANESSVKSSISCRLVERPAPPLLPPNSNESAGAAYATSKAALAALTREMAHDFGAHGIRVNAIAPGEIDTAILSPGTEEIVAKQIPLHRLGTTDEVAKIIYVLCTETSSYVTGAEIHINGGQHV